LATISKQIREKNFVSENAADNEFQSRQVRYIVTAKGQDTFNLVQRRVTQPHLEMQKMFVLKTCI